MVLHDSLNTALADAHRRDLIVAAERYRTARHVRAAVRAARAATALRVRLVPSSPPDPVVTGGNRAADRRYAVSR